MVPQNLTGHFGSCLTRCPLEYVVMISNVQISNITDILSIQVIITLELMPGDLVDGKSTLVQVMAWCRQATRLYLNQCRPRSPKPYGDTRPQWVNHETYSKSLMAKEALKVMSNFVVNSLSTYGLTSFGFTVSVVSRNLFWVLYITGMVFKGSKFQRGKLDANSNVYHTP